MTETTITAPEPAAPWVMYGPPPGTSGQFGPVPGRLGEQQDRDERYQEAVERAAMRRASDEHWTPVDPCREDCCREKRHELADLGREAWTMRRSLELRARGIEPTAETLPVSVAEMFATADAEEAHTAAERRREARRVLEAAGLPALDFVPYQMTERLVPMTDDERGDAAVVAARRDTNKAGRRSWLQARWRKASGREMPESLKPWRAS